MQQCWHPQLRFATSQLQADNPCRTSNPCRKIAVTSQQLWFAYSQRVYITSHFDVSVLVLISNTAVTIFTVLWSNITICWNISRNGKLTATGLMLFIHAYGDKSCKSEADGARPLPSHPSNNIVLDISLPNDCHNLSWLDPSKSYRWSNIAGMASSDPSSAKGREVELLVR